MLELLEMAQRRHLLRGRRRQTTGERRRRSATVPGVLGGGPPAGYLLIVRQDETAQRDHRRRAAPKGDKAPIQAGQRWHVERTNAWHNGFNRLQRCCERNEAVLDAFFDLADAIITGEA
jgi:hypothetical protein